MPIAMGYTPQEAILGSIVNRSVLRHEVRDSNVSNIEYVVGPNNLVEVSATVDSNRNRFYPAPPQTNTDPKPRRRTRKYRKEATEELLDALSNLDTLTFWANFDNDPNWRRWAVIQRLRQLSIETQGINPTVTFDGDDVTISGVGCPVLPDDFSMEISMSGDETDLRSTLDGVLWAGQDGEPLLTNAECSAMEIDGVVVPASLSTIRGVCQRSSIFRYEFPTLMDEGIRPHYRAILKVHQMSDVVGAGQLLATVQVDVDSFGVTTIDGIVHASGQTISSVEHDDPTIQFDAQNSVLSVRREEGYTYDLLMTEEDDVLFDFELAVLISDANASYTTHNIEFSMGYEVFTDYPIPKFNRLTAPALRRMNHWVWAFLSDNENLELRSIESAGTGNKNTLIRIEDVGNDGNDETYRIKSRKYFRQPLSQMANLLANLYVKFPTTDEIAWVTTIEDQYGLGLQEGDLTLIAEELPNDDIRVTITASPNCIPLTGSVTFECEPDMSPFGG